MTVPASYQVAAEQTGGGSLFAGIVLILATMTTGAVTGVFGLYANTIMPGLGRTDDRTFVGAFQQIDRAITTGSAIWHRCAATSTRTGGARSTGSGSC